MTPYNVFGGSLSLTQSINQSIITSLRYSMVARAVGKYGSRTPTQSIQYHYAVCTKT